MSRNACFTLHFATPDKTAFAPLNVFYDLRVVTATTAKKVASLSVVRRFVTNTTSRAQNAVSFVPDAEVGRILGVN